MTTTVTSSIGTTARDYSTIQAWEDAIPANITDGGGGTPTDEIHIGECYNDSEFTAGATIAGITTDADHYVELTAATGESFQDHADVRTNALKYDQSKGVGVAATGTPHVTGPLIHIQINNARVLRLQLQYSNTIGIGCQGTGILVKDCVLHYTAGANLVSILAGSATFVNLLLIQNSTNAGNASVTSNSAASVWINCTLVRPSDITPAGTGITWENHSGTITITSCAVFGFTTPVRDSDRATVTYSASDVEFGGSIGGGTGNITVAYSQTAPFDDADKDSQDFRLATGSDLIDAGNTNATYPDDISGFTRGTTTDGDIGAWEFGAAAGGATIAVPLGTLTLTANAPTLTRDYSIAVPLGTLTLTNNAPTVITAGDVTIEVPAGELTLTGSAPVLTRDYTFAIPSGALTLAGNAPTVDSSASKTISIPLGTLTIAGFAPVFTRDVTIEIPAGALSLAGFGPTIARDYEIGIPTGTLSLTAQNITVSVTAAPGTWTPVTAASNTWTPVTASDDTWTPV